MRLAWIGLEQKEACGVCIHSFRLDLSEHETRVVMRACALLIAFYSISESMADNATGKVTMAARSKKPSQATSRNGRTNGRARTRFTEDRTSITCRLRRGYAICLKVSQKPQANLPRLARPPPHVDSLVAFLIR